jgi:hypothetical protein
LQEKGEKVKKIKEKNRKDAAGVCVLLGMNMILH